MLNDNNMYLIFISTINNVHSNSELIYNINNHNGKIGMKLSYNVYILCKIYVSEVRNINKLYKHYGIIKVN